MSEAPCPQSGDLIRAYLPSYLNKGVPGDEARLCLVMALEVDEDKNKVEGFWVVRLSEMLGVERKWDYRLKRRELAEIKDPTIQKDYVIRTTRIDLIPATDEFLCKSELHDAPYIYGRVIPTFWDHFLPKLQAGQTSSFDTQNYGPRGKLTNTVVKTSLNAQDSMAEFDYETVVTMVELPPVCEKTVRGKPSKFAANFDKAEAQLRSQWGRLRRMIHEDFIAAGRPSKERFQPNLQQTMQPPQPS